MNTPKGQLSEVLSEFARTMLTDFPIQGILDQLVRRDHADHRGGCYFDL